MVVVVDKVVNTGSSETVSVGFSIAFSVVSMIFVVVVSDCFSVVSCCVVGTSVVVVVVVVEVSGLIVDSRIQPSGGVIGDQISEKDNHIFSLLYIK